MLGLPALNNCVLMQSLYDCRIFFLFFQNNQVQVSVNVNNILYTCFLTTRQFHGHRHNKQEQLSPLRLALP